MITLQEQEKLRKIMAILADQPQEEWGNSIDVSNRLRDEQGRFLPHQSRLQVEELPLRSIRVVKVKGTYGTYLIKDKDSYERLIGAICIITAIVAAAIVF